MNIRIFRQGDEAAQVRIYNTVAQPLPSFKSAEEEDVRQRTASADAHPDLHLVAESGSEVVGYLTAYRNGRIGYPWCLPGHETAADPLLKAGIDALKRLGVRSAFAAYRADWPQQRDFFLGHGFRHARDMMNFVLDVEDMPTRLARPNSALFVRREDVPEILQLVPHALRVRTAEELERHLFDNPHFPADSVFALRGRRTGGMLAVAILVYNPTYANVRLLDAGQPCFRLGAFGTEGMQVKKVNALFSFLARDNADFMPSAMSVLEYAALRLERTDTPTLAAQVPSDVPHLVQFYQQQFTFQASFPVFELNLAD